MRLLKSGSNNEYLQSTLYIDIVYMFKNKLAVTADKMNSY